MAVAIANVAPRLKKSTKASAIHMLESKIGGIEYEMNVMFSYEAVEKAVLLSDRYMHEAYLPEKAIEVCREAALMVSKSKGKSREAGDALVTGATDTPVPAPGPGMILQTA